MFRNSWMNFIFCLALLGPSAWGSQWMGIIGDAGLVSPQLTNLKESITAENITSLVLPGDNLYWGTYGGTWNQWKRAGFKFDVVAIGNHHGGYQKEMSYFGMPAEYYSTVKHGARFIVLNSDNAVTVDQQFEWLEYEIAQAKEKLVFLVYHHPTFDTGTKHSWRVKERFQLRMRPFLRAHKSKITAVLVGHEHIATFLTYSSIPVVVAGSGREANKATVVNYQEDGFDIKTKFLAPQTLHWAALEILDGAEDAWIHFIRVSDQRRVCSAYFKDGTMNLSRNCL